MLINSMSCLDSHIASTKSQASGDVFAVQHLLKWQPNDEPDSSPGPCQLLWPPFPWPKLGKREAIGLGEDHRDFLQFAMENGPDVPRDDQHYLFTLQRT